MIGWLYIGAVAPSSGKSRASTAPQRRRRHWLAASVELKTDAGSNVRIKAPRTSAMLCAGRSLLALVITVTLLCAAGRSLLALVITVILLCAAGRSLLALVITVTLLCAGALVNCNTALCWPLLASSSNNCNTALCWSSS